MNTTTKTRKSKSFNAATLSSSRFQRGKQVQGAYASWVPTMSSWKGAVYITLTFKDDIAEPSAWRYCRRFYNKLMSAYNGSSNWKKKRSGTLAFVGMEFQKSGRRHFHMLIDKIGSRLTYPEIGGLWRSCGSVAGWLDAQGELRDEKAIVGYISKYITKDGEVRFLGHREAQQETHLW